MGADMPKSDADIIDRIYERFNARNIDGVLAELAEDVVWANAMEGGHVHGHKGVRDYWLRQWAVVRPHVEPLAVRVLENDIVRVDVRQSLFDLDGKPLAGQSHGLEDKTVIHVFRLKDGKIARFDVQEA